MEGRLGGGGRQLTTQLSCVSVLAMRVDDDRSLFAKNGNRSLKFRDRVHTTFFVCIGRKGSGGGSHKAPSAPDEPGEAVETMATFAFWHPWIGGGCL
jgi:hypothetical protein